jgi:rhodanese-related sulfurtransferase
MQVSLSQLVAEARAQIDNVNPEQMSREAANGALVVDIREASERDETGAVHAPRGLLEFEADASLPSLHPDLDPSRCTIPYFASGGRSALAVVTLQHWGCTAVAHIDGGIQGRNAAVCSAEITLESTTAKRRGH